jgi:hypothetical protein
MKAIELSYLILFLIFSFVFGLFSIINPRKTERFLSGIGLSQMQKELMGEKGYRKHLRIYGAALVFMGLLTLFFIIKKIKG